METDADWTATREVYLDIARKAGLCDGMGLDSEELNMRYSSAIEALNGFRCDLCEQHENHNCDHIDTVIDGHNLFIQFRRFGQHIRVVQENLQLALEEDGLA